MSTFVNESTAPKKKLNPEYADWQRHCRRCTPKDMHPRDITGLSWTRATAYKPLDNLCLCDECLEHLSGRYGVPVMKLPDYLSARRYEQNKIALIRDPERQAKAKEKMNQRVMMVYNAAIAHYADPMTGFASWLAEYERKWTEIINAI